MWLSFSIFQFCSSFFFTLASMSINIKNWCKKHLPSQNYAKERKVFSQNSSFNSTYYNFVEKVSWNIFTELYTYCLNFSVRKQKLLKILPNFTWYFVQLIFASVFNNDSNSQYFAKQLQKYNTYSKPEKWYYCFPLNFFMSAKGLFTNYVCNHILDILVPTLIDNFTYHNFWNVK